MIKLKIMNTKNWLIIGCFGVLLLASVITNVIYYNAIPKTAYVDIHQVFEAFEGQKELSSKLENLGVQQKTLLDSMAMHLRTLQQKVGANPAKTVLAKLESQQMNYVSLNREFTANYEEQDRQYSDMVWKQINEYITAFGKEKGYDYIYGANGNGTLMYASNHENITSTIIEYINQKYEGF